MLMRAMKWKRAFWSIASALNEKHLMIDALNWCSSLNEFGCAQNAYYQGK